MPRGQKECSNCGQITGPRAYECPKCGNSFNIGKNKEEEVNTNSKSVVVKQKKRGKKKKGLTRVDWKTLQPGDFIKAISGTGPCWPLKDGGYETLGYKGVFRVKFIGKDGIGCYSVDKKYNLGFCYIYMGDKYASPSGVFMRSHKIRKVDSNLVLRKYNVV